MTMNRYNSADIMWSMDGGEPRPDPNGAWVKFADADMAQAALVERAARLADAEHKDRLRRQTDATLRSGSVTGTAMMHGQVSEAMRELAAAIRALAPDAGVKAVAELRAERDHLLSITAHQGDWVDRAKKAEADNSRLAADNANLQARFEKLRGHLGYIAETSDLEGYEPGMWAINRARSALAEDDMLVSVLATREAWKGILPGGEG